MDFCVPSINSTARNKQEPPLQCPGQTSLINPSTAFSCLSSRELELQLRVSQRSPGEQNLFAALTQSTWK